MVSIYQQKEMLASMWKSVDLTLGRFVLDISSCAWTAPSHYLNHWWNIVHWTLGNKLQWNFNRNSNIFIQENAFENVVCEIASICLGLNVLRHPDALEVGYHIMLIKLWLYYVLPINICCRSWEAGLLMIGACVITSNIMHAINDPSPLSIEILVWTLIQVDHQSTQFYSK